MKKTRQRVSPLGAIVLITLVILYYMHPSNLHLRVFDLITMVSPVGCRVGAAEISTTPCGISRIIV